MTLFYLYKIINLTNQKIYIGMTSRPEKRFKEHLSPYSTCTKLKNSIQKHGAENFEFTLLCAGEEKYILDLEEKAITSYDSIKNGYNLVHGNPRTGALLLSEEMKQKISEGLNRFYSLNPAWNSGGLIIGRRQEYDPHYVSGFWFPHPDDAVAILGINKKTFYSWRNQGTLGQVQHLREDSLNDLPVYVAGYWFDSYDRASEKLNQKPFTLKKRVREGFIEQKNNKTFKTGQDNHMTGRTGSLHHNSTPVIVDYIKYESIADAAKATGLTKKMIYTRLNKNIPGFSRIEEK